VRCEGVYIAGTAVWLPPVMTARDAVAAGFADEDTVGVTGQVSVAAANAESGPEMAAWAGREALARSGFEPDEIALALHAGVFYSGHDMWAPAAFVQRTAMGTNCLAMEVRQASNGGMACLEVAVAYLRAGQERRAVLLTTGDRFCRPRFDRWRSDPGTVYADGGTALVVSTRPGFARLRSLVSITASDLEGMARGADPFADEPFQHRMRVDVEACSRAFLGRVGLPYMVSRLAAGQLSVVSQALDDAGVKLADIARFALPHLGRRRLDAGYLRPLGIDVDRTTWPWSRGIGHLGAGDPFAGLDHLVATEAVAPGQLCLLASVGAGFTWSAAVVEILACPHWSNGGG